MTYLNSQQVKALSTAPSTSTQNTPFLEYYSVYWGVYAKRDLSDCARSLALELLNEDYGWVSAKLLLAKVKHFRLLRFGTCSPFSGLHCASFFGIVEVVAALIEVGCYDINEEDFSGCTPLSWAARNGHAEAVEFLLGRREVNPDKPDNGGRTSFSYAAGAGHEGVVEILLEREEVNPDKPDNYGQTPFSCLAWSGDEGVVNILLGREDINPDTPANHGQTPLSYAAIYGREGVVKILLGREEVNPDESDNYGRTPLSLATERGHERVVALLQSRKVVTPPGSTI